MFTYLAGQVNVEKGQCAYLGSDDISAASKRKWFIPAFCSVPVSNEWFSTKSSGYDSYGHFLSWLLYGIGMHGMFRSIGPVAVRTRWLAILAASVAGATGAMSVSLFFPIVPSLMIIGVIVQSRFHRCGFWLMLSGAILLSLYVLPTGCIVILSCLQTLRVYHDFNIVAVTLGWVGSFFLVALCDAALIIESRK